MLPFQLTEAATAVLEVAKERGVMIATAESCTGGLVAGCLTEVAGSSAVVERGFVTYSNEAKVAMLRVPLSLIHAYGAVSEEVARAMAEGAVARSNADLAVSITGVAGPGGGTATKPVGLVHLATAYSDRPTVHEEHHFDGPRSKVRLESVRTALRMLADRLVG